MKNFFLPIWSSFLFFAKKRKETKREKKCPFKGKILINILALIFGYSAHAGLILKPEQVINSADSFEVIRENGLLKESLPIKIFNYISDIKIPSEPNELLEWRTANSQTFDLGNGRFKVKAYTGNQNYYDLNSGNWYLVKTATTTAQKFQQLMAPTIQDQVRNWFIPTASADVATTTTGNGDGVIVTGIYSDWNTANNIAAGEAVYYDSDANDMGCVFMPSTVWYLERGFYPFDTSIIPNDATIESATLTVTSAYLQGNNPTTTAIIQTNQPDETILTLDDFNNMEHDIGSDLIDESTFILQSPSTWTLNALGLTWIKRNGETANCGHTSGWTCLGILAMPAITNTEIPSGSNAGYCASAHSSEATDVAKRPVLEIIYSLYVAPTSTTPTTTENLLATSTIAIIQSLNEIQLFLIFGFSVVVMLMIFLILWNQR